MQVPKIVCSQAGDCRDFVATIRGSVSALGDPTRGGWTGPGDAEHQGKGPAVCDVRLHVALSSVSIWGSACPGHSFRARVHGAVTGHPGCSTACFGELKWASHWTENWVLLSMKPVAKHWLITGVGRPSQNLLLLCFICMEVNYLYLQVCLSLWRQALSLDPAGMKVSFGLLSKGSVARPISGGFFFSSLQKAYRLLRVMYFSLLYYSTCMEIC